MITAAKRVQKEIGDGPVSDDKGDAEALERESRIRQEGFERQAEAFRAGLRDERKAREREDLRIEGRSLGAVGAKAPGDPSSAEAAGLGIAILGSF